MPPTDITGRSPPWAQFWAAPAPSTAQSWAAPPPPTTPSARSVTTSLDDYLSQLVAIHKVKCRDIRERIGERAYLNRPCPMTTVGKNKEGEFQTWYDKQYSLVVDARLYQLDIDRLLKFALDLAPGGKLRHFVPYEPRQYRALSEKVVTLITMGNNLIAMSYEKAIYKLHQAAEQFQAAGRRAIDPLKD